MLPMAIVHDQDGDQQLQTKIVRNFVLPFPLVESHGQDLRDLINLRREAGNTDSDIYQHLIESARRGDVMQPTALKASSSIAKQHSNVTVDFEREAVDDPHRLARTNLDQYQTKHKRYLQYWKDIWYSWRDGAYEAISEDVFAARLNASIKLQFDAAYQPELDKYITWRTSKFYSEEKDRGPPKVRKVTTSLVKNVIAATKSMITLKGQQVMHAWIVDSKHKDTKGWCMAANNGVLNISNIVSTNENIPFNEKLIPHTPDWFSTAKLAFDFDPDAKCPIWEKFLGETFSNDQESIDCLRKWFGYLLTPDNSLQKILMIIGEPRSGKGTIIKVMDGLFGKSNIVTPTLSELSGDFSLQPLIGKTIAIFPDVRLSNRADESVITERLLSISGGDPQNVTRKHKETLSAHDLIIRFTFFSNELPKIKDTSAAFLSRCIFLKTPNSKLGQEDYTLQQRLLTELPGILNWSIYGRHMLDNSTNPKIKEPSMAASIRNEMSTIVSPEAQFVTEECIVGAGRECDTLELFGAWEKWCQENDIDHVGTIQSFSRKIKTVSTSIDTMRYQFGNDRRRRFVGINYKNTF